MAEVMFFYVKRLQKHLANGSLKVELIQPHHRIMNLTRYARCVHARFLSNSLNQAYPKEQLQLPEVFPKNQFRTMAFSLWKTKPSTSLIVSPKLSGFYFHNALPFASMIPLMNRRSYSSSLSGKGSRASDELSTFAQQFLDSSHPYLNDVIIPLGGALTASLIAWFVMPRILRKLYAKSAMQGPDDAAISPGSISISEEQKVPYEKSFWGAPEDPVRYLVTFSLMYVRAWLISIYPLFDLTDQRGGERMNSNGEEERDFNNFLFGLKKREEILMIFLFHLDGMGWDGR